jgi:hypothetical protein
MHEYERIEEMLKVMDIEECLEHLDITPEEVLRILFRGGYVALPPWLDNYVDYYEDED